MKKTILCNPTARRLLQKRKKSLPADMESVVLPSLWSLIQGMGASKFDLGVVVAAYSLGTLLAAPLFNMVCVRLGPLAALELSMGLFIIANAVYAAADSWGVVLLARLLQGSAAGIVAVARMLVAQGLQGLPWGPRAPPNTGQIGIQEATRKKKD